MKNTGMTRNSGFTLVEILLALAIFGVLSVLAYRATAALTESEARLSFEAQRWRTIEGLFTRFEADIRQAVPRPVRYGARVEAPWLSLPPDDAGNSALVFTRSGAEFADEPAMAGQRVGYRLRNHALEIAYWPHLDNVEGAQPAVYVLADGVSAFRVEYLTGHGAWRSLWPLLGEADIPRAVRVTLILASGEAIERWFALR
jgi:general secretion pathway protein J